MAGLRFLVDAHLPRRSCDWLAERGHDSVHTLDLPAGNRTADPDIVRRADDDGRIVVTKDADFARGHLVLGRPRRLLLVSTGNIANSDLERVVRVQIAAVELAFATAAFVELLRDGLVVHR